MFPLLDAVDGGVSASGGADVMCLSSPQPIATARSTATSRFLLGTGERAGFALHHARRADPEPARVWSQDEIAARVDDTVAAWQSWSELHQSYVGPWHDLVHHSGRVLQALSFQPTGAICAAATTSLPEVVGGDRNWDYRYAWVRDASFTIEALWVAACPDEANEFFEYMTTSAAGSLERDGDLQIMFGIGGEHDLTERELPHLPGWRGSAPGARRQRGMASAPARRLRRAARARCIGSPSTSSTPTGLAPPSTPPIPRRRSGRHRRSALAGAGSGDLGGAR